MLLIIIEANGYDDKWIKQRLTGVVDRHKLTDVWKESGITKNYEYGILTNEIYQQWSGMKASQYKEYKGLRKESLRDNMTDIEVTLADLGEIATRELVKEHKPYGLKENREMAKRGGRIALYCTLRLNVRLIATHVVATCIYFFTYQIPNLFYQFKIMY